MKEIYNRIANAEVVPADIAQKSFIQFLDNGLQAVITFIADVFGLGDVPDGIKKALQALHDAADRPIKAILNAIGKPIKEALDKLLQSLGLKGEDPAIDPDKVEDSDHCVYVNAEDGEVYLHSEKTKVSDKLDEWSQCPSSKTTQDTIKAAQNQLKKVKDVEANILKNLRAKNKLDKDGVTAMKKYVDQLKPEQQKLGQQLRQTCQHLLLL